MTEAFDDLRDFIKVCVSEATLLAALEEIAKGEGRFNVDPLAHAENTIEDMKAIAREAIAKRENAHKAIAAQKGGADD